MNWTKLCSITLLDTTRDGTEQEQGNGGTESEQASRERGSTPVNKLPLVSSEQVISTGREGAPVALEELQVAGGRASLASRHNRLQRLLVLSRVRVRPHDRVRRPRRPAQHRQRTMLSDLDRQSQARAVPCGENLVKQVVDQAGAVPEEILAAFLPEQDVPDEVWPVRTARPQPRVRHDLRRQLAISHAISASPSCVVADKTNKRYHDCGAKSLRACAFLSLIWGGLIPFDRDSTTGKKDEL
eukprot:557582-Rhodomonas_salina.1